MGRYVFKRCFFRFEWFEENSEHNHGEFEMDYPEGPGEGQAVLRSSCIARALKEALGLTMLSSVDNYFTFDISENIFFHPSVWYACNCVDAAGKPRRINVKIYGIKHMGEDLDAVDLA